MQVPEPTRISALEAQLAAERTYSRRLEEQLRNLADHDPVTDLPNRRSLEQALDEHLASCTRYGPEGALLLIGLDGLQHIAVTVGQAKSDEVLATLAEMLRNRLRTTDVLGVWGPDELVVLLPRAGAAGGAVVADSLVGIVGGTATSSVSPGSLTASIGVAPVLATSVDADQLVGRARRAMEAARARRALEATRGQENGGWAVVEE